jgi:hypothetical protein
MKGKRCLAEARRGVLLAAAQASVGGALRFCFRSQRVRRRTRLSHTTPALIAMPAAATSGRCRGTAAQRTRCCRSHLQHLTSPTPSRRWDEVDEAGGPRSCAGNLCASPIFLRSAGNEARRNPGASTPHSLVSRTSQHVMAFGPLARPGVASMHAAVRALRELDDPSALPARRCTSPLLLPSRCRATSSREAHHCCFSRCLYGVRRVTSQCKHTNGAAVCCRAGACRATIMPLLLSNHESNHKHLHPASTAPLPADGAAESQQPSAGDARSAAARTPLALVCAGPHDLPERYTAVDCNRRQ